VFKPEGGGDVWIIDLDRGNSTRLTFDPGVDRTPVWSPDGKQVAFASNRKGGVFNLYVKASNGTGEEQVLLETPHDKLIDDWSPDGRFILYEESDPKTKSDLWVLPVTGDRKPMRVLSSPYAEQFGSFSPDGRWIAYASDENGVNQVFVQGFPEPRGKWQVSTSALAVMPRWRPDGKELFYDGGGPLMAVDVDGTQPGGEFTFGAAHELFNGLRAIGVHNFDVAPDSRRFLVVTFGIERAEVPIVVVLNWQSGILH
jgi:eukaryotic-like serine/threonine-protein kinase